MPIFPQNHLTALWNYHSMFISQLSDFLKVKEDVRQRSFSLLTLKSRSYEPNKAETESSRQICGYFCATGCVWEGRGTSVWAAGSGAWHEFILVFEHLLQSRLCTAAWLTPKQRWTETAPFNSWKKGAVFCEARKKQKKKTTEWLPEEVNVCFLSTRDGASSTRGWIMLTRCFEKRKRVWHAEGSSLSRCELIWTYWKAGLVQHPHECGVISSNCVQSEINPVMRDFCFC